MTRSLLTTTIVALALTTPAVAGSPFGKNFSRQVQSAARNFSGGGQSYRRQPTQSRQRFDNRMGLPQKYIGNQGSKKKPITVNPIKKSPINHKQPIAIGNLKDRFKNEIIRQIGAPVQPKPGPVILPLPGPGPLPGPIVHPTPKPCPVPKPYPVPNPTPYPWPHPTPRPCPAPICLPPVVCPTQPPVVVDPIVTPLPIDEPVLPPSDAPVLYSGQRVTLPADGLVGTSGRVIVKLGPLAMPCTVLTWGPAEIVFETPNVPLVEAAPAQLVIQQANGTPLAEIAVKFSPVSEAALLEVPVGSQMTLSGTNFGDARGQVRLLVGPLRMEATVLSWTRTSTVVVVPYLEIADPTRAELIVMDSNGTVADRQDVQLVAAR